jgi:hypothetical protein
VPPRNVRQFVELLFERDDNEIAAKILSNYCSGLDAPEADPPPQDRHVAWRNSPTSTPAPDEVMPNALAMIGEQTGPRERHRDPEPAERRFRPLRTGSMHPQEVQSHRRTLLTRSKE